MDDHWPFKARCVTARLLAELRAAGFQVDPIGAAGDRIIVTVCGPAEWMDLLGMMGDDGYSDLTVAEVLTKALPDSYGAPRFAAAAKRIVSPGDD